MTNHDNHDNHDRVDTLVPRGSVPVSKHAKQPLHVQAKAPSIGQQNSKQLTKT